MQLNSKMLTEIVRPSAIVHILYSGKMPTMYLHTGISHTDTQYHYYFALEDKDKVVGSVI